MSPAWTCRVGAAMAAAAHDHQPHQVAGKSRHRSRSRTGRPSQVLGPCHSASQTSRMAAAQRKTTSLCASAVRHDAPTLHHEDDPGGIAPQVGLRKRIARNRDQVGLLARFQCAHLVGQTQQVGGVDSRRLDRPEGPSPKSAM